MNFSENNQCEQMLQQNNEKDIQRIKEEYELRISNIQLSHHNDLCLLEKRIKSHLSYRIGNVILKNLSLTKFYKIPFAIYKVYNNWKKDKQVCLEKEVVRRYNLLTIYFQDELKKGCGVELLLIACSRLIKEKIPVRLVIKVDNDFRQKNFEYYQELLLKIKKGKLTKKNVKFCDETSSYLTVKHTSQGFLFSFNVLQVINNKNAISINDFKLLLTTTDLIFQNQFQVTIPYNFIDKEKESVTSALRLNFFVVHMAFNDYNTSVLSPDEIQIASKLSEINQLVINQKFYDAYKGIDELDTTICIMSKSINKFLLNELALFKTQLFYVNCPIFDLIPIEKQINYTPNAHTVCYMLHNSLPYSSGGYATRAEGVAKGLIANGYIVHLVTKAGYPYENDPLKYTSFNVPLKEIYNGLTYYRVVEPMKKRLSLIDYVKKAAISYEKLFLELKPSIVLSASDSKTGLPSIIAARKLGIPVCYEIRGLWQITRASREKGYEKSMHFKFWLFFEMYTAMNADYAFTITKQLKNVMVKHGVKESHIDVIPNSCMIEEFKPIEKDKNLQSFYAIPDNVGVIGYVGTFLLSEGLDDLVRAAALLKKKGIEFRLLLVGSENVTTGEIGPLAELIKNISEEYGFNDWVIMPGRIPRETVAAHYSLIDIAPFCRKECWVNEIVSPMKPLEAFSMKKAVVASSVAALKDMVLDGKTGLIFEKGNIIDLASKLEQLLINKELCLQLGKNARNWVIENRTWQYTTKTFVNIFKKLEK